MELNITMFCRFSSAMSAVHIKRTLDDKVIVKSAGDDRHYRGLELNNGMRVLLISDQQTDKSSAAMDVYVGMWYISFCLL